MKTIQLAESGARVALVDADMRRSVMRGRYQLSGGDGSMFGLVHYLAGQIGLEDVLCRTNSSNGFLLPTVNTVSNPAVLLQSERFADLLDTLVREFDYVLLDTPPLGSVADSDLIASRCDGGLLVVRAGAAPRALIASSLRRLDRAGCELMGVVLNRAGARRRPCRKYGKYSYSG